MNKIQGKEVAQIFKKDLVGLIQKWIADGKPQPKLVVILVGEDPASEVYVKHKVLACQKVGMDSEVKSLPKDSTKQELKNIVDALNKDSAVTGILVQLPLPSHLDEKEVLSWIDPMKDPDCLTATNIGLLFSGQARIRPCTPYGILLLLKHYKIPIQGQTAVVVGRSQIVGKPMSLLLLEEGATVTTCHSKTNNLSEHTRNADIVVVACGKHHLLKASDFKKGATVIDVGIHRIQRGNEVLLEGDVCPEGLDSVLSFLSPVPGGVGPMTITGLLLNTFTLAQKQSKV